MELILCCILFGKKIKIERILCCKYNYFEGNCLISAGRRGGYGKKGFQAKKECVHGKKEEFVTVYFPKFEKQCTTISKRQCKKTFETGKRVFPHYLDFLTKHILVTEYVDQKKCRTSYESVCETGVDSVPKFSCETTSETKCTTKLDKTFDTEIKKECQTIVEDICSTTFEDVCSET